MKKIFQKNAIYLSIASVAILILTSAILSFYSERVMNKALFMKDQAEMVKRASDNTFRLIRKMDVSLRGYALIREDKFLFYKIDQVKSEVGQSLNRLDSLLKVQNFQDANLYPVAIKAVNDYVGLYEKMVKVLDVDTTGQFIPYMREDYGAVVWKAYKDFDTELVNYQDQLLENANKEYEVATFQILIVHILLVLVGLPTLIFLVIRLRKEEKERTTLLSKLDDNNRKFLFDSGDDKSEDGNDILEKSMGNLQKASEFVTQMTEGNYEVKWQDLNDQNVHLNTGNLVGRLVLMREQMKKVKQEDEQRMWSTEGLAQLSEIIRKYQTDFKELSDRCLVFIVKYLQCQQGSIFIVEEEENGEPDKYLKLVSCFAFDRKKYIESKVIPGEGILGQTYLEGETVLMTELPQGYTYIKSGLGDATPGSLMVVPMKFNEEVRAVVEVASLKKFTTTQKNFLEKAGEFIASAIATVQNNEKTNTLLEQFRDQTEQLQAQEEELRQNMEELEATQEEMRRKERELEKRLEQAKS